MRTAVFPYFFAVFLLSTVGNAQERATVETCPSYIPTEDSGDPTELSLRGVACFEAKEYLKALIYYRKAYAISKSAVLRGGIGRSLQELGHPDLARQYFEGYLGVASSATDGYQKIEQRLEAVRTTLKNDTSEVTITSAPGDAEVFVVLDGEYWEPLGTTPVKLRMLPGEYRLVFRKQDFMTREASLEVDGTDPTSLETELVPQEALFNVSGKAWKRRGAYLMLGSIPVFAGSAALFWIGEDRLDEADEAVGSNAYDRADELRDEGYTYRTAGIATAAVGGAALITGVVFYLTGMDAKPESAMRPFVGPNSIGIAGSF